MANKDNQINKLPIMMPPGIRPGEIPPFHRIGEYVFQDLCRDLFDAEPDIAVCEIYGVRGQSQDGIDLIARRKNNDGIELGQCKCYEDFPPRYIRNASDEFFAHWDERWSKENVRRFILFVACDLSERKQQDEISKQTKRFAEVGIIYEVWSAAKIRNKLAPHVGIVSRYFSSSEHWVKDICGVASSNFPPTGLSESQISTIVSGALITQVDQYTAQIKQLIEGYRVRSQRTLNLCVPIGERGGKIK
jgi:hypothetical protein